MQEEGKGKVRNTREERMGRMGCLYRSGAEEVAEVVGYLVSHGSWTCDDEDGEMSQMF